MLIKDSFAPTPLRAGDVFAHRHTGEQFVAAYVLGQNVSAHSFESQRSYVMRWTRNIEHNWPEDSPVAKPKKPPGRLHAGGVPFHATWPHRTVDIGGHSGVVAPMEVLFHASDVVRVRAASNAEHEATLRNYAWQNEEPLLREVSEGPCAACEARDKEQHPPTDRCGVCLGARVQSFDRRPAVCAAQLAALHPPAELAPALEPENAPLEPPTEASIAETERKRDALALALDPRISPDVEETVSQSEATPHEESPTETAP